MADRGATEHSTDDPVTTGVVAARAGASLTGAGEDVLTTVTHDSRAVTEGALFCCVVGERHDGHDHAAEAVSAGAAALLVQRPLRLAVPQLLVQDVRVAMGPAAAVVHGDPARRLRMTGVTGTNGKTTVVSMLGHVLESAGHRVGMIGTLTGERTTPESTELQAGLAAEVASGTTHMAMEVSSHALTMHRVDGMVFDVAVFTNLGRDHLDFHGSEESYFAAKALLFTPEHARRAVVNVDDVHGRLLNDSATIPTQGYSVEALADLHPGPEGSSFTWRDQGVQLPVPGRHNVANALAAAEAARAVGVADAEVAAALATVPQVPGRFERVPSPDGPTVVVDFAHTPDALEVALAAAGGLRDPGGTLWVVFGCGGDRDAVKRPEMGRVASVGADRVVLTSDNPRSEDPLRIIDAIRSGCEGEPLVEADRRAAIRLAVANSARGDVVLIAGKGHERGQVLADRIEPFDDRRVAAEVLRAVGERR